jgi:uncharacterized protein YhaN
VERLGLRLPPEALAGAYLLERELQVAERRREEARVAEREITSIERERDRVQAELSATRERLESLRAKLSELGKGDPERGLEEATTRIAARETARQIRTDLKVAHPDLEELRRKISEAEQAGEPWVVDDDALASAASKEEDLSDEIEGLRAQAERLQQEVEHLSRAETVDQIEGETLELRRELEDVARERDRKFVLASIVREADRRFREEHQPEVMRRAGEYLSVITAGRYDRILVREEEDDPPFLLRGPGYPHALPVEEPISTGTREQVYLAVRLAIVDHLDAHHERLPLFIDEAFVNWDRSRWSRGAELLERVSRSRQVFVFTCHEPIVLSLEGRGARILLLEGPS